MDIRNNIARVSKIEVTKAEEFGARLALHLQIELRTEQLSQFTEGRYGIADRAVYAELYEAWRKEYEEAEARWQDRTNRIMAEYNAACEQAEEDGRPRPKPPAIRDFCGPAEPARIKTSRACNSLAGWFVDLRAELTKADHSVVTVELGAKTKGKPKMVTEGELVLLELRLDERKCERTAERDEVWEWLQLAGQEFRVYGAQITLDEAIELNEPDRINALLKVITEHVAEYTRTAGVMGPALFHQELVSTIVGVRAERGEMLGPEGMAQLANDLATIEHGDRGEEAAREVAGFVRRKLQAAIDKETAETLAQPSTPDMNAIASSIEADLQAKGHDVAVEAVPVEESKTIAQWSQELGEPFTVEEYIAALKATGYNKPIRPVTRLTKTQHLQVLVGLSLRVAPTIDEVRKQRWEWAAEYGCSSPQYFDAMSAVLPNPDNTFAMSRMLTEEEHEAVCAELRRRGVNGAEQNEADEPEDERTPAYWAHIAGVPQDDYMTALQAVTPSTSWSDIVPEDLHVKVVGVLERWAERDSKRDEQSEAERRDFGVCKTANTWAREAGANGKAYVRTAIALGVFPEDASPIRVKFNESTHLRIMAAMSGEQPAA